MSQVEVINFGCRLNIAEGEAMRAAHAGDDQLIIINSCAVTQEAERQARQAIRRAARRRPDARIIVTGCAAQIEPARFAAMPQVSAIIANADKHRFGLPENAMRVPAVSGADHARAFVEVQNGCDHRCTFCIIPFGRGDSRSLPAGLVIDAVRDAVARGHREVVLTGVDLTSYGPDLPGAPSLGQLVERILTHVPELERLRLSSLDSVEIDERLFELLVSEPRMMPHVHLSLQAGDDMILKRMKRRHSRTEAIALVERLKARRPEIAIGADIIAGFPTETDAMFANSLALLDECDIVFAHVFPFSPRNGTPAARMPQLEHALIRARALALREHGAARQAAWLRSLIGSQQKVLIERNGQSGHAPNFAHVALDQAPLADLKGQIMTLNIIAAADGKLCGSLV